MLSCRVSYATTQNTRDFPKPNEDYILADAEKGIFILLDGITRVHSEYTEGCGSAAMDASRLFAQEVYIHLISGEMTDPEAALREAILLANRKLLDIRSRKSLDAWVFYPGTLGIIAILQNNRLYYACAGDCLGVLLRGSSRICFGEQQTIKAVELYHPSKRERYEKYCNHPENPLSYAIFNGDASLEEGLEAAWLDLHPGDRICLASDGAAHILRYEKPGVLRTLDAAGLLEASRRYDTAPFAQYADDKSMIILDIC